MIVMMVMIIVVDHFMVDEFTMVVMSIVVFVFDVMVNWRVAMMMLMKSFLQVMIVMVIFVNWTVMWSFMMAFAFLV